MMFDVPIPTIISQLDAYNLSSAYNFSGVITQIDKRLLQMQSAVRITSSLTLDTTLDSYANYGKQMYGYLVEINQLSGLKCFWGNVSLCNTCAGCTTSQSLSFEINRAALIAVEPSVVAIIDAVRLDAAAMVEFVQAAKMDQSALQEFRTAVAAHMQKSSDAVRSVAASLGTEWRCLGVNNAVADHRNFKSLICDIDSKSASAILQISCS